MHRGRTITTLVAAFGLLLAAIVLSPSTVAGEKDGPDLVGTPDLFVREDVLAHQWVVRDENLPATFCSVIEGNVTPGLRRLVRFTVMTPNVGDADINLGDPNVHLANDDGLYETQPNCHNHFHFKHYALYELLDSAGRVWKAAKRGFCMLDTDPNPAYLGQPPRAHQYRSCGRRGIPGNQGISHGWADTYRFFLGGQYFVLDGGDGQPTVPPGEYTIRITVNPPYAPPAGGCPLARDAATGLCHQLPESNYANNVGQVTITIPDHPGKHGVGPLAGTPHVDVEVSEEDQDKVKDKFEKK